MASNNSIIHLRVNPDLEVMLNKILEIENWKRKKAKEKLLSKNRMIENILTEYVNGSYGSALAVLWWEEIGRDRKDQEREAVRESRENRTKEEDWI